MLKKIGLVIGILLASSGCNQQQEQENSLPKALNKMPLVEVKGVWVTEQDGRIMHNPQTSALANWRGGLLTLSDRSADPEHRLKLRPIDPKTGILIGPDMPMLLSEQVQKSCFAEYVSNNPDLEALTVDPDDDTVFYIVTEDASYAAPMSKACQQHYANSGSTDFPTLLIRLKLQADNTVSMTHIRPIKFATNMQVGDFPNDGIEALAFGKSRTLYIGIEKDKRKQARVFMLRMTEDFWNSEDFALVSESAAKLPKYAKGNHPINGMDYYLSPDNKEFLLLAARNDESLWVVDLSGEKEPRIIPFHFYAQIKGNSPGCENEELMKNASIEGVAVIGNTLWLINDPWKRVYASNIQCAQNEQNYKSFAPLLFNLAIDPKWFN